MIVQENHNNNHVTNNCLYHNIHPKYLAHCGTFLGLPLNYCRFLILIPM